MHCMRFSLPIATKLNALTILAMLIMALIVDDFAHQATIFLVANAIGLYLDSYYIPLMDRQHGGLYAHRLLVRSSAATMLSVFLVGMPIVMWQKGLLPFFLGHSPWPAEYLGACSPLLCVALSGLSAMMASTFHLIVAPMPYVLAVGLSVIAFALTLPPYTPLGHSQEVMITVTSVVIGDLVGRSLRRAMWQSFTTSLADKSNLRSMLEQIDTEKKRMLARLEQIDAEKDRLTYDLLLATRQRPSSAALPTASSSCGSDAELARLNITAVDPAKRSPGCSSCEGASTASDDGVILSAGLRKRLNASFGDGAIPWKERHERANRSPRRSRSPPTRTKLGRPTSGRP